MSEKNSFRLSKLVREFNVKIDRILDFLSSKGITGLNPNSKVSHEIYMQILQEFDSSKAAKISAQLLAKENELKKAEEIIRLEKEEQKTMTASQIQPLWQRQAKFLMRHGMMPRPIQ